MHLDGNIHDNTEAYEISVEDIHKITTDKFRKAVTSKCFSDEDIHNHFKFMSGMLKSKSEDLLRIVHEERPKLVKNLFTRYEHLPDEVA